jgi:exosortase
MPADSATASAADPPGSRLGSRPLRVLGFWAFLAALHAQLALALVPSWNDGTYYDYGFLVPFLAPYCFLARWREAGIGEAELDRRLRRLGSSGMLIGLVLATLLLVLPLRLVQGADSGWRAPLYLHALLALGLSAFLLFRIEGRGAMRYWGCALLVLLAVPLPSQIETALIRNLTSGVLESALFYNRMLGLPLESAGETIFANGIPLQVSDGCSGIRSFQSGIFAGFALGELMRLSLVSRGLLLGAGLGIAFLMNAARVIYLVRHAVAHPGADLQRVHDISGYVSLTTTFLLIAAAGWLLGRLEGAIGQKRGADG